MKLSVPANYDFDLISKLRGFPIEEIYGKFPSDFIGGGRPSYMGTPLSAKDLACYVSLLKKQGIAFNYLLNSSCLGNEEWGRRWQRKLVSFLEKLGNMGINRFTVSTPFLLERIKKIFPQFYVKAGIYSQIDTPRRAIFWSDLGADALTLESFSINRNFSVLKSIRKAVSCELHLIANHPCLPNCPMQSYHQNCFAHSSAKTKNLYIDYCFLKCTHERLEEPSNLIKACWIRPEDIDFYEKIGYTHFKLLERGIPSCELLKRVKAYSQQNSVENLAELILPYGFPEPQQKQRFWFLRYFFKPLKANPFKLKLFFNIIKQQGMLFPLKTSHLRIDSKLIPRNFIQGFENKNCSELSCSQCGYCEKIAAEAVSIDEIWQKQQIELITKAEKVLISGSLWNA